MRLSSRRASFAVDASTTLALLGLSHVAAAISFQAVPSPNLDLSQLGRVAVAGNFDSISLYEYLGQSENNLLTNGSQSLLGRYPSGAFAQLESADANILALCPFVSSSGTLNGIIVAGNFTSLGGQMAQGAALYDPVHDTVTPLPGINGMVSTVYCDPSINTVFFGGLFSGLNSTNAISWTTGWTNLPFAGFNGPVNAIQPLANGNIIFGGAFTGLGNTTLPTVPDAQVVNVGAATITASATSSNANYNTPSNIICKTSANTGPGNSWILPPNTPGYWQASFEFGFEPTKLRLYNSKVPGFAAKTWHFLALPLNGILNMTYTDPATGELSSCTNECPLPNDNSTYQDFYFVNVVGMNAFQIIISDWYGNGGGLGGIELFQNDIYSYAIPDYNEPVCDNVSNGANATSTGAWTAEPSGQTTSGYLSTYLASGTDTDPATVSVVFQPDIKQSGNYSIAVYTPGCIQDNTCSTRGEVTISGTLGSATGSAAQSFSTTIYQSNYYDKYDYIYYGYVEANSDSFRPTVTLAPTLNQTFPLTVVAQRLGFVLSAGSGDGGLNGLFEYNPNLATATTDFTSSTIDHVGTQLESAAQVNSLQVNGDTIYVGGAFSTETVENLFSIVDNNITALTGNGLNAPVQNLYFVNDTLYVGGNFTDTKDGGETGLNNVAAYSTTGKTWSAFGAGVNGAVHSIVPLEVNATATELLECLAVSGNFDTVNSFANYSSFSAAGVALWVPAANNWLHNLDSPEIALSGSLNTWTVVPGSTPIFAGALASQDLGISGVASLSTTGTLDIQQLPINIDPQQSSSLSRRALEQDVEGVVTGVFYNSNGLNITILGGQFSATATNGSTIHNLAFINGSDSDVVSGLTTQLDSGNDAILALDFANTTLFAGGSINNGILFYDLQQNQPSASQPPALTGGNATVYAIAAAPTGASVYVGGSFASAGSFGCPGLCVYNTASQQWIAPGPGLSTGSVVYTLTWASNSKLIISGKLGLQDQSTTLASFDTTSRTYTAYSGASSSGNVPGPISALTATSSDYTSFWAAGTASNNSAFLTKFDGTNWTPVSHLLDSDSSIMGLQILSLSTDDASNNLIGSNQVLLVTGALKLPNFGNASAALFDGISFTPFILASTAGGNAGSISRAFVQNPQNLFNTNSASYLAKGFIVLIALAIALALIFLLVILGILAERLRRRREGYMPAPTRYVPAKSTGSWIDEKKQKFGADADPYDARRDIPPEQLFGGLVGGPRGEHAGFHDDDAAAAAGAGIRPGTGGTTSTR